MMTDAEVTRRARLVIAKISDPTEAYIQMLCDTKSDCYRLTEPLKQRMVEAIFAARQPANI